MMNPPKSLEVVIVDDHPVMRRGLEAILLQHGGFKIAGQADGESAALEVISKTSADCALVDLSLREGSGLDLVKKLKQNFPQLPVVVVSMHEESLYAERALRAGAKGYVTKEDAADHVVEAIQTVLRGGIYVSAPLSQKIMGRLFSSPASESSTGIESLTDRELQIFEFFGEGKDVNEIAQILQLSSRTVETHRYNIINKLNLKKSSEMLQRAIHWVQVENRKV